MADILGPASDAGAVTVRPPDTRIYGGSDTWFAPCDPLIPGSGTDVSAPWLNAILAQIRAAIDAAAVIRNPADDLMLWKAMQAAAMSGLAGVPTGAVLWWPSQTLPGGWVKRNGAAVSRSVYAALFGVIGTTYGVGDGATTFNLPDDRGLFVRGFDDGAGIDPGRGFGSVQSDDLKAHTHPPASGVGYFLGENTGGGGEGVTVGGVDLVAMLATGSTGGIETRPKNRAYLPIIKY